MRSSLLLFFACYLRSYNSALAIFGVTNSIGTTLFSEIKSTGLRSAGYFGFSLKAIHSFRLYFFNNSLLRTSTSRCTFGLLELLAICLSALSSQFFASCLDLSSAAFESNFFLTSISWGSRAVSSSSSKYQAMRTGTALQPRQLRYYLEQPARAISCRFLSSLITFFLTKERLGQKEVPFSLVPYLNNYLELRAPFCRNSRTASIICYVMQSRATLFQMASAAVAVAGRIALWTECLATVNCLNILISIMITFLRVAFAALCQYQGCSPCAFCQCPLVSQGYAQTSLGCRPCPYFCSLCSGETSCTSCAPSFASENGKCLPCPANCGLCSFSTGSGLCSQCVPGYFLVGGVCYPCPYANSLTCLNQAITSCKSAYYVSASGAQCLPCPVAYCAVCDSASCSTCLPSYFRNSTGQCVGCISNCASCSNSVTCAQCLPGFSLVSLGRACYLCSQLQVGCFSCTSLLCLTCSTAYTLSAGLCSPSVLYDSNCAAVGPSGCASCLPGFFNAGPVCAPCSLLCLACTAGHFGLCSSCSSIARISGGKCLPLTSLKSGSVSVVYLAIRNSLSYFSSQSLSYCIQSTLSAVQEGSAYSLNAALDNLGGYQVQLSWKIYFTDLTAPASYQVTLNGMSAAFQISLPSVSLCQGPASDAVLTHKAAFTKLTRQNLITFRSPVPFAISQLHVAVSLCKSSSCVLCVSLSACLECNPNTLLIQEGDCVSTCANGFFLLPALKRCYSSCPSGYYQQFLDSTCQACALQLNCATCESELSCITCAGGLSLVPSKGLCVQSCPLGSFSFDGLCLDCKLPCLSCTDAHSCLSCRVGMLFQKSCKQICPLGYYPNYSNAMCMGCNANYCSTCLSPTLCLSCLQPYSLITRLYLCAELCPSGLYSQDSVCTVCPGYCLTCTSTGCLSCVVGFLRLGQCFSLCPQGFYGRLNDLTCQPCAEQCTLCQYHSSNCQSCKSPLVLFRTTCFSTCPSGYFPRAQACIACQVPCLTCLSASDCLTCSYSFLQGVRCVQMSQCKVGSFANFLSMACQSCVPGCAACYLSAARCTACAEALHFYHSQCLSQCPPATAVQQASCQYCSQPCELCYLLPDSAQVCLTCYKGYLFLPPSSCLAHCPQSHYNDQERCNPCPDFCSECSSANKCTLCNSVTYLLAGTCVTDCSTESDKLLFGQSQRCWPCLLPCIKCSKASLCISCVDGWFLFTTTCLQTCPYGTFADSASLNCVSCLGCLSCTNSANYCLSCPQGLYLYQNSCLTACPQGYFGETYRAQCLSCQQPCETCSSSANTCTSCSAGRVLQGIFCTQQCPEGSFIRQGKCEACQRGCSVCQSQQSCLYCSKQFSLLKVTCLESCPEQYYSSSRSCLLCQAPCFTCISQYVCLTCAQGFLLSFSCLNSCPNTFYNSIDSRCLPCPSRCLNCRSSVYCTSCPGSGAVAFKGECLKNCPAGLYLDYNIETCLACNTYCQICTSNSVCLSCKKGSLYQGACQIFCPIGTLASQQVCLFCTHPCLTCVLAPNICQFCADGFFKYGAECLLECPQNTFSQLNICTTCAYPCLSCRSSLTCDSCADGFFFLSGNSGQSQCLKISACPNQLYLQTVTLSCLPVQQCQPHSFIQPLGRKCYPSCPVPFLISGRNCTLGCAEGYSADQNLHCKLNQGVVLLTAEVKAVVVRNRLMLFINFSRPVLWLQTPTNDSFKMVVSDEKEATTTLLGYDSLSVGIGLQDLSVTQPFPIRVDLVNATRLLRAEDTLYPLSTSSGSVDLPMFQPLTQQELIGSKIFQDLGSAVSLAGGLFMLALVLVGRLGSAYAIIHPALFLYQLLFIGLPLPLKLQNFLAGLAPLHLRFMPNPFPYPAFRIPSPPSYYDASYDCDYYRTCGPQITLFLGLVAVLISAKVCHSLAQRAQWKRATEYLYRFLAQSWNSLPTYAVWYFCPLQVQFSVAMWRNHRIVGEWIVAASILAVLLACSVLTALRARYSVWLRGMYSLGNTSSEFAKLFPLLSLARVWGESALVGAVSDHPFFVLPILIVVSLSFCGLTLRYQLFSLSPMNYLIAGVQMVLSLLLLLLSLLAYSPSWAYHSAFDALALVLALIVGLLLVLFLGSLTFVPDVIELAASEEQKEITRRLEQLQQAKLELLRRRDENSQSSFSSQQNVLRKIVFRVGEGGVSFKPIDGSKQPATTISS